MQVPSLRWESQHFMVSTHWLCSRCQLKVNFQLEEIGRSLKIALRGSCTCTEACFNSLQSGNVAHNSGQILRSASFPSFSSLSCSQPFMTGSGKIFNKSLVFAYCNLSYVFILKWLLCGFVWCGFWKIGSTEVLNDKLSL